MFVFFFSCMFVRRVLSTALRLVDYDLDAISFVEAYFGRSWYGMLERERDLKNASIAGFGITVILIFMNVWPMAFLKVFPSAGRIGFHKKLFN